MRIYRQMHSYPVGTQIQQENGYIKIKTADNKWQGMGAHLLIQAGIKLQEGDRVFFADGDRTNLRIENLRRIHFSSTRYIMVGFPSGAKSAPIHVPGQKPTGGNLKKVEI